jgi:hypothetical protein
VAARSTKNCWIAMKGKPMKLSDASLIRRADVSSHDPSAYEAIPKGALNILGRGRPAAPWERVSPAIFGEIDHSVYALAGR